MALARVKACVWVAHRLLSLTPPTLVGDATSATATATLDMVGLMTTPHTQHQSGMLRRVVVPNPVGRLTMGPPPSATRSTGRGSVPWVFLKHRHMGHVGPVGPQLCVVYLKITPQQVHAATV